MSIIRQYRIPLPKSVDIEPFDGSAEKKTYRVVSATYSGSRGWEFKLTPVGGYGIHRVCHAPAGRVGRARTSGETITYNWTNEGGAA